MFFEAAFADIAGFRINQRDCSLAYDNEYSPFKMLFVAKSFDNGSFRMK
jgi:hypothetical protein